MRSVAVMATQALGGKTIAFVEGRRPPPRPPSHAVDYVASQLAVEHVFASAAMPVLFPPVHVARPNAVRGWYFDGTVRLHAPLKPALDLGGERLVIVGTTPLQAALEPRREPVHRAPGIAAGATSLLNAVLEDAVAEDVRSLSNVNEFFAADCPDAAAASRYRHVRGKPPYRRVPYVFIAPEHPGLIGEIAQQIYRERYRSVRALRFPDLPLIARALGDGAPLQGDFLSYLLFDRDFADELIDLGRADARRWLATNNGAEGPWRTGPLPQVTAPTTTDGTHAPAARLPARPYAAARAHVTPTATR